MILIDICSGTGSVSRALRGLFPDATIYSIDILPSCDFKLDDKHTHFVDDIRNFDFAAVLEGQRPDFIWMSPPCTQYSRARSNAKTPRDFELADSIVAACMRIVDQLCPAKFALENPDTGYLKKRDVIQSWSHFYRRTSYCMFGFPYMKATSIWTNADVDLPFCYQDNRCESWTSSGHLCTAQKGESYNTNMVSSGMTTTETLHRVPRGLIELILNRPVT